MLLSIKVGGMLNTCENLTHDAQNVFSGSSTASLFPLFFFLDHKSPIAHRFNDLKEETFKGV